VNAKNIATIGSGCVACGCCVNACPKNAIQIHLGILARVDGETCVGCGQCANRCPAAIITVLERVASR